MVEAAVPATTRFGRGWQYVHTCVGFSKGYNFVLCQYYSQSILCCANLELVFIFAGALMGFSLARLQYLSYNGIFCGGGNSGAAPGECYYYTRDHYKIGMMLHLFCIIPAGLLACFQFVPVIRHKFIMVHRINGYIVLLLALIGIASKWIIEI
jgi:hypothetical protein